MRWHRGHLFHIAGSPDVHTAAQSVVEVPDGALLVDDDGRIAWSGEWDDRPAIDGDVLDHHGAFVLPGFVDAHVHFPQVHCLDAYGGGELLDWLERVVFPSEARLADPDYARRAARAFCANLAAAGTTTSLVFGSQFPIAQEALADEVAATGLRMVTGRTIMTSGPTAAGPLVTDHATAIALVREEVERWQPRPGVQSPFAGVALVPRYALSVDEPMLRALGELYEQVAALGVHVTTHLSENRAEVAAVRARYGVKRYLDVYDGRFLPDSEHGGPSLLGPRTVLAHAVHCREDELVRMADTGTSIAHCPVSQDFLGSGTMDWNGVLAAGTHVALGTDIAAGDEWFMPRVMNACYKAHMNAGGERPTALAPGQLLYLGTLAGAQALSMSDRIGNLDAGKDADFVVLDPSRSPTLDRLLAERQPRDNEDDERDALLFALLMAVRETVVADVYVAGRRLDGGLKDG
jgi:guanine deaminase